MIATCQDRAGLTDAREFDGRRAVVSASGVALDFNAVYHDNRGRVLATVRGVIGASDEIEDVVQLVFIEIHRCLSRFEGRSKLSTWIHRVAVNVALQHLRKKKRKRWLRLDTTGDADVRRADERCAVNRLEGRQLLRHVEAAAAKLSEKKRVVWVLHELQGLDPHQIGEILGIPMNTTRSRLLAARRDLKAELLRRGVLPGREKP